MNQSDRLNLYIIVLTVMFLIVVIGVFRPLITSNSNTNTNSNTNSNTSKPNGIENINNSTTEYEGLNDSYKVRVVGNQLIDQNNNSLHLVGSVISLEYDVSESLLFTNVNEHMFKTINESGANYVTIGVNSELWSNNARQSEYRDRVNEIIGWCRKYELYYQLKLQSVGSGSLRGTYPNGQYCRAGNNWQLTDPNYVKVGADGKHYPSTPFRERAFSMWIDLAKLYGNDPNLLGYSLLNEPYSEDDWSKWENVIKYYEDCIRQITQVDPYGIFFVMAPKDYGVDLIDWISDSNPYKGYLNNTNVVYEYHNYYKNYATWVGAWGYQFYMGNETQGQIDAYNWHITKIMPVYNDDHPVFCGEFGISGVNSLALEEPRNMIVNNYEAGNNAQIQIMNELGIHWTMFYMRATRDGNAWGMTNIDGIGLSERGEIWANNIPEGLHRPIKIQIND